MIDVGYVVSDLCITGPQRGSYLVWVPKKHGDPSGLADYNGFGVNLGNLGAGDLMSIKQLADYYFPLLPLSSGGHPPFNPNNGMVSVQENPNTIDERTCPVMIEGQPSAITEVCGVKGDGRTYIMRQSMGPDSLTQVYSPGFVSGYSANTHLNADKGLYCRLSIGTRVAVCDYFIIGQLAHTQNNLIQQIPPLNRGMN